MKINSDIFYSPKKAFDIKIDQDIPEYSHSDFLLAILFTHLKDFYDDIENTRKRIGVKEPVEYKTLHSLIELYVQINGKSKFYFEKLIEKILLKYHLTHNWNLTIISAVLTNTLVIPEKNIPIQVNVPDDFYKNEVVEHKHEDLEKNIKTMEVKRALQQSYPVIKYPAIYFTRYTTPSTLVSWILANRKTIKAIQYFLPKEQNKRIKIETIHWGHLTWTLMKAGFSGWTEIAGFLDRVTKDAFKHSKNENDPFEIVPTPDELEKMYKSYIKTLQKIIPSESQ